MISILAFAFGGAVAGLLAQVGAVDVDPTLASGLGGLASVHLHTLIQTRQVKRHVNDQIEAHVRTFHPPAWVERGEVLERLKKERELTAEESAELETIKLRALGSMRGQPSEVESAEYLKQQQARDLAEAAADVRGVFGFIRALVGRR